MSLIAALLLALPSAMDSQAAAPSPAGSAAAASLSSRMAPLAPLVGEWHGSGWMLMPDGTRQAFESIETVTTRLSGAALLIEGRHFAADSPGRLVHDAIAMVTWDQRAGGYRFRSALASGSSGDFPLQVGAGRFAWQMEIPDGRIEYVAEFTSETWIEKGRRIGSDGRSVDFFEMSLRRQ